MARGKPTRPELVAKIEAACKAAGIELSEFERRANLTYKFFSDARQGKHWTARSAPQWKRAEALLRELGSGSQSRDNAPASLASNSAEWSGTNHSQELIEKIRAADSPDECIALQKLMDELAAKGELEVNLHRALNDSIKERRQQFELKAKQEEQNRSGEPIVVEVHNIAGWQVTGPCPYCSGTGRIEHKDA